MDKLFLTILNMSLTGSAVIVIICIARLFLKKAPKIISYLLWAIAGFRLVFPFSIESLFSLIPFKPQPIPMDIALQPIPRVDSGMVIVDNIVNNTLPAPLLGESVNPLQIWIAIGMYAWLIGVVLLVVYAIVSYAFLKMKMHRATCIKANIYDSQNVKSPFVLGFFSPKIYLPTDLSEKEIMFIISHEKTHIKRCDHVVKFAAYLVLCLHWFNPLVWVAFWLMGKDMEMSCDERVLKELGTEIRSDYSLTLLSLATERHIIGGSPLAFGENGVKARIKNILNFKKPAVWAVAIAVISCVVVAVCLLTNPVSDKAVTTPYVPEDYDLHESSLSQTEQNTDDLEPIRGENPLILTKETADEFINQTLSTFKLNSDNTVSFTLPSPIPTDKSGKTKLIISSSATFSSEPSSSNVQEILDWKSGWHDGESYIEKLDVSRGKLTRLFLRVAFMTNEGENSYREYAANYIEFIEPFKYDTPVSVTDRSVEINQEGASSVLKYTKQNGDTFSVTLMLPKDLTLSTSENYPEYVSNSDYDMPAVVAVKDGNPIGTLTLYRFATDDKDDLTQIDTTENTIPLSIFAAVANANHAEFDNYKVCKSSAAGANATAEYLWQDLTDYGGRAPDAPWLKSDCILAYDYEEAPFFINLNLTHGSLSITELENLAKSIVIMG